MDDHNSQEMISLLDESRENNYKGDNGNYMQTIKGIVSVFTAVILLTASAISVQLLERRIPDLELNAFRSSTPLLCYSIGILITRKWPVISRSEIKVTVVYTVQTFLSGLCAFVSVSLLPIAFVQCVIQTVNITTGLCLFSLFWNEKLEIKSVLFAAMCICGVVLVIQPDFIFTGKISSLNGIMDHQTVATDQMNVTEKHMNETLNHVEGTKDNVNGSIHKVNETINYVNGTLGHVTGPLEDVGVTSDFSPMVNVLNDGSLLLHVLGYLSAIVTGIANAFDILLIKRNPYIIEHMLEVLFWCFFTNTFLSVIFMVIMESPVVPNNWYDGVMVAVHCLTCVAIWPLFMYAPKCISGNTITAISSTSVVFNLISQYTILSSILPGNRNWIEIVGVVLVLLGSAMASILEMLKGSV